MIRRYLVPILFFCAALLAAPSALAQSGAVVSDIIVAYDYGEQIIIRGTLAPEFAGRPLSIRLSLPDDPNTVTQPLPVDETGTFTFIHLPTDRVVRAFSDVTFEFVVERADGSLVESEAYTFFYADNRFEWRTLEAAPFRVHWYAGEVNFAQQVLDSANRGLERAKEYFDVQPPWFDIYVYADVDTYRAMRGSLGSLWAGGHVQPETGMAIVALSPGPETQAEIERKIPHEVAHYVLYLATGGGFGNLPAWLNEGFASMMETFPNPDYAFTVSRASEDGALIPLGELCIGFPPEAAGALQAYAQSEAAVRYVADAYGPAGLRSLVDSYSAGASCSQGPLVEPIRVDLETLDSAWRSGILPAVIPAEDSAASQPPANESLPWVLVFVAAVAGPGLVLLGALLRKGK